MNADFLLAHFDRISDVPDVVPRLRRFVLDLAVRGKLVEQDPNDEPVAALLNRIRREKVKLIECGNARKQKPLVPLDTSEIPFPIPVSWQWSQLAEVGFINPRNSNEDGSQASFVQMSSISAEYGVANAHEVRPWGDIKSGFTHFAEGDVALAKITPCFENGKSTVFRNLEGGIGAGTTELHVVRPVFVSADYILIFLKSPYFIESGIPKMTGTAGQKRVSTEYFAYSPFPLPSEEEQHRIVAKVDELMALCDRLEAAQRQRESRRDLLAASTHHHLNNGADTEDLRSHSQFFIGHLPRLTARPDQVKQLRQTILNLAVRGKLVPQDPKDEPAQVLLNRLALDIRGYSREQKLAPSKPDPIESKSLPYSAPEGWEWTRFSSLLRVITDGDHQPPPKEEDGIAFLTIGNITNGYLDFSNCRFVSQTYYDSLATYRKPAFGDILYTVVGATFGRPVLVNSERPFCVQRHIAILKPTIEGNTGFLRLMLASPFAYEQANRSTTGSAQPTIPLRPLRNFIVALPPLAEQHRIVAKVDELIALCDQLESRLTTAQTEAARLLESVLHRALQTPD